MSDLGVFDQPTYTGETPDLGGGSSSSLFGGLNGSQLGGAAALGVGALGFGSILAKGESPLPAQYGQAEGQVPWLQSTGQGLVGQGSGLVSQGQSALAMAQAGQLTPEQQAQLSVYGSGLTNQARQQFYNMGQNPDQSTAFLSTTADIDAHINAMAQQQIQTTIQLGLGEISSGNSLISQGAGFENAGNQILLQAGQAQLQQDKDYSSSLTSAFSSIGSLFATGAKLALA
jgi:hypothetical protein